MIELISEDACIGCNICVKACPANVFEARGKGVPAIERQSDCQTCFLCEIYCPTDAIYVAPDAEHVSGISVRAVDESGLFGSYAYALGWRAGRTGGTDRDVSYRIRTPHWGDMEKDKDEFNFTNFG